MAKRDVILYYLQVENEYLEMLKIVNELKRCAANGEITQEAYESAVPDIELIKANYERIGWIVHLLNLPNRRDKQKRMIEQSWYNLLQSASKEAILDESRDALIKLKQLVTEGTNTK